MLSLKGLSNVFGRGRSGDSKEAKELLTTVDDLLTQSNKLLNSISRRIPSRQFETFEYKYTELNLMVIDIKDDVREREQKRIFFESEEEKELFQSDIRKLLQQCETYRNDVVVGCFSPMPLLMLINDRYPLVWHQTASRRVQGGVASGSILEETSSDTPSQPPPQASNITSPWLSIVADATFQEKPHGSDVDPDEVGPTKRFIATVSRNVQKGTVSGDVASPSQNDNGYFRILIYTNLHHPDENDAYTASRSQDDLLRLGDMLMKSDPQELEGHQIVDSHQGPSFIASFMSTFAYNPSNMLAGGML
ncbi:unnamed protein product [Rhizoctonia solani]|uniref:Uncharacterized protein n=1 Tax=Rhizoctonia solani TaxID=456999 RepID=A0A8H2Y573_9AGAM|nr:unnamed protein product [Rhizoctonia solani]